MIDTTAPVPLRVRIEAATAWCPAPGDVLEGVLVAVTRRSTEYGAYPCVIVDPAMGEGDGALWAWHAFHTIAKEKLKELRPTPGERITIAYPGPTESRKRTDKDGNPVTYHPYIVYCPDRADDAVETFDWDDEEAGF